MATAMRRHEVRVSVHGVEVGGYAVERCHDGTTRAAWWGALALFAAQAEVTTAVRLADEQVVVLDTVGEVVADTCDAQPSVAFVRAVG